MPPSWDWLIAINAKKLIKQISYNLVDLAIAIAKRVKPEKNSKKAEFGIISKFFTE